MKKKTLSVLGVVFLLVVLQSCQSKPEEGLLQRYFHADSLNDITTMSTMALEPIHLDFESWEIFEVGEEIIIAAPLPDLDNNEKELKKKLEDHIGPTVEADDALYAAKEKLDRARTRAARNAAQREMDEAQAKFDEEREIHRQIQKSYNEAKAEAAKEEEIATFSLGAGDLPNIREMQGEAHSKEVKIRGKTKTGEEKNYNFFLKKYDLKDETLDRTYRGRWIIVIMEPID